MEKDPNQISVVSCPSKVLLIGGYAVLKEKNKGLTLGLSPRFYATYLQKQINETIIEVSSPQIEAIWRYRYEKGSLGQIGTNQGLQRNPFVEGAIEAVLCFLNFKSHNILEEELRIFLFCDPQFYSAQKEPEKSKHYPIFDTKILKKTGLGSSSCVIVVTVATLLIRYGYLKEESFEAYQRESSKSALEEIGILHTICQFANSLAQNKIGSGFDIATCLFGSHLFERYPEQILAGALKKEQSALKSIFEQVNTNFAWDGSRAVVFSKKISMIMLDFTIGSDTRVLVSQVRRFLQENPEYEKQFLSDTASCLEEFMRCEANYPASHEQMRQLSKRYRAMMKNLGNFSKAEIEPDVITIILDEIFRKVPEIIYCISPGAGGYDAACILYPTDWQSEDLNKELKKLETLEEADLLNLWAMSAEKLDKNKKEETLRRLKETRIDFFRVRAAETGIRKETEPGRLKEIAEMIRL